MSDVEVVRRFNRTYTPRIGALDDSFLGSGLPLAAARLLFEVGPDGAIVRDLRRRLGVDSGYLSRLLRSLEDLRLVTVHDDPADRRRRLCRLTAIGKRTWNELDDRSNTTALDLLAELTPHQRLRLVDALATAELLVRTSTVSFVESDPTSADSTWALTAYFDELDQRFIGGFDRAGALGDAVASMVPPTGVFVLAKAADGIIAGCGGLQTHAAGTAEVKRMWIHRDWRGAGLGSRLLADLEQRCVELGHETVVLDTNGVLVEAIAMYRAAGYAATGRYNDNPYAQHWFTKTLNAPAR